MKKLVVIIVSIFFCPKLFSQVGINTTDPNASLDVQATNIATPSNEDGLLIPRVDEFPVTDPGLAQDGMMVFVTGNGTPSRGFYYWDNGSTSWVAVSGAADTDWTTVGSDIERQSGDVYIGNTNTTNNDLYISDRLIDWDDPTYFLNPDTNSRLSEIQLDNGTTGSPSLYFQTDNTTGLSGGTNVVNIVTGGTSRHSFTSQGQLEFFHRQSVLIGYNSGNSLSSTFNNSVLIGNNAGQFITTGLGNNAIGFGALDNANTANGNNIMGQYAATDITTGSYNTGMGGSVLADLTTGNNNTAIGSNAGNADVVSSNNTYLGYQAGAAPPAGNYNRTGNVFLGYTAGYNQNVSNRLFIENSSSASPLIYGEFDNDVLRVNGELQVNNPAGTGFALPTVDGTVGQVLTTDGAGQISFSTPTTGAERINDLIDGKSDNDGTSDGSSIFLGINAGAVDDLSNNSNVGIGFNALEDNIDGALNVAIGWRSLAENLGDNNTAMGYLSAGGNTTGNGNTAIGRNALVSNTTSSNNTALGFYAGWLNTGSGNLFLGANAGFNHSTTSNKLYIENSDAGPDEALIYGDFGSDNTTSGNILRTNSEFQIGNPTGTGYAFPTTDGTAGQVLTTDGAGNISFTSISNTDDQTIDTFSFNSGTNIVSLEIEDDGIAPQTIDLSSLDDEDADWLTTVGSNIPTSNSDDIYTSGHVSIGSTTNLGNLNIIHNEASDGSIDYVMYNSVSNSGNDDKTIIYNSFGSAQAGDNTAIYNLLIGNGSGVYKGIQNYSYASVTGDIYGMYNTFAATGNGAHYGSRNYLSGSGSGSKYGSYNQISSSAGGTHYGIYSDVQKASGYAGYFIGRMALGNGTTNRYIMPATDGTAGQVITTNGAGQLSFTTATGESSTASNGLTEVADDIQLGGTLTKDTTINNGAFDLEINSTGVARDALIINKTDNSTLTNTALDINKTTDGSGSGAGVSVSLTGSGTGALFGIDTSISNTGSGTKFAFSNLFTGTGLGAKYGLRSQFFGSGNSTRYGVYTTFSTSATGLKYGVYNNFDSNSGNYYGMYNNMVGATNSAVFGLNNTLSGTGTGAKTGVSNSFSGANGNSNIYLGLDNAFNDTGNGDRWGVRNNMDGTGTGTHYGSFNDLTGTGSGAKYGSYNYIDSGAGGTHYGVYSEVDNSNGYAGYFLGQNYVSNAIGINNPNPDGRLDIIHNSTGDTSPHIMLTAQNANTGTRITFDNAAETNNNWVLFARADDAVNGGTFNIYSSEISSNVVRLDSDGKMGVMRNAATNTFEVQGDASKTTAGSWLANSDRRLKTNISSISGRTALEKIEKMRGVTYKWNDKQTGTPRPEGIQYGFIAQELMEVFPEKVTKDNLGFYQTAYGDYDPLFVEAIKELKSEVETLAEENAKLKAQLLKMEQIEARLSALEKNSTDDSSEMISEKKK